MATAVNQTDSNRFRSHCNFAILNMTEQDVGRYMKLTNDRARVEFMYPFAAKAPLITFPDGKNSQLAMVEKEKGNQYYKVKKFDLAMEKYNQAILYSTPDEEGRTFYSLCVGNKSAIYFELREYEKAINCCFHVLELNNHPCNSIYRIYTRIAKCHDAMKNYDLAMPYVEKALDSLKMSDLNEASRAREERLLMRMMEVYRHVANKKRFVPIPDVGEIHYFPANPQYPAAHRNLTFEWDDTHGRYCRATDVIPVGEVIMDEAPYITALDVDFVRKNCNYCTMSCTSLYYPCPNCTYAIFCSTQCQESAMPYHHTECPFLRTLYKFSVSVNVIMALRVLIRAVRFEIVDGEYTVVLPPAENNCDVYKSDSYENMEKLCTNVQRREIKELIAFSSMSIYVLRILKKYGYFPEWYGNDLLSPLEAEVGGLLLRYMQQFQYNAHEVSETVTIKNKYVDQPHHDTVSTGGAVYLTIAMLNHSCDPTVIRYNVGGRMVVRTVKTILPGDLINENYGPLYFQKPMDERHAYLMQKYSFDCGCIPCVMSWPMKPLEKSVFHMPCKACNADLRLLLGLESITCPKCQTKIILNKIWTTIMAIENYRNNANECYANRKYSKAFEFYCKALDISYKFKLLPDAAVVKLVLSLKKCAIHFGNQAE